MFASKSDECLPWRMCNYLGTYIHHFSSVRAIRSVFLGNYRGNRPNKLMEQERLCLMHLVQGSHLIGCRL